MKPREALTQLEKQAQNARKRNKPKKAHARAIARLSMSHKKQLRKRLKRKAVFLEALAGTGGILSEIAKNVGVRRETIKAWLQRENWDDMREAWAEEKEQTKDLAEKSLRDLMMQGIDLPTKAKVAQFYLSKIDRERFGDVKNDTNININNNTAAIHLPANSVVLPIEMQRKLLEMGDAKEQQILEASEQRDSVLPAKRITSSVVVTKPPVKPVAKVKR